MAPDVIFLIITGIALIGMISYFIVASRHKNGRSTNQIQPKKEAFEGK